MSRLGTETCFVTVWRAVLWLGVPAFFACGETPSARVRRDPVASPSRKVELVSAVPLSVIRHGMFEYRVSAEVPAERRGTAVRVRIRVEKTTPDSVEFQVPGCSMDVRLYRTARGSRALAYSWRRDRICADAGSRYPFLGMADTLLFQPTLRGDAIGENVRAGRYELAVTLPGIDPEREMIVALVRLGDL